MATKKRSGSVTPPPSPRQEFIPAPRTNGPSTRARNVGRGNEEVTTADMAQPRTQSTTEWDRIPNAIEYLRRYLAAMELKVRAPNTFANDPTGAIQLMDQLYQLKEKLQKTIKTPCEALYDIMRFTVVPKVMEDAEMSSTTVNGVGRVNVQDDISVSIVKEHKDEFYQWLIAEGKEDLITETINAQTLAAWYRARLQDREAKPIPKDFLTVKPFSRAQITRS